MKFEKTVLKSMYVFPFIFNTIKKTSACSSQYCGLALACLMGGRFALGYCYHNALFPPGQNCPRKNYYNDYFAEFAPQSTHINFQEDTLAEIL